MRVVGVMSVALSLMACDRMNMQRDSGTDVQTGTDVQGDRSNVGDVPVTTDGGDVTTDSGLRPYMLHCESFFAARIVEKATEADSSFPSDCDVALTRSVGLLRAGGMAMCNAGETANDCRDRLYRTPPSVNNLDQTCWTGNGPAGCMHASFLSRCADGTDSCVEDEAVCQDGTRPMVFAEAATAGPSNVWLFHLGGEGSPCAGVKCWMNYRYGTPEFSSAMSTLHPDRPGNAALRGSGIFNGDTSLPYARINRVRFERCSDAVSDAIETAPVADGVTAELAPEFPGYPLATSIGHVPVWHRGYSTFRSALHHMTTMAGRDRNGDGVAEMPSLADAQLVILSASSDASMWVVLAADRLAAELRSIAGPSVEVRVMIDGMFPSMLDNEARYQSGAPANFNMIANSYAETRLCGLPDNGDGVANEACSDLQYKPGAQIHDSYVARGVKLDESCEAMHGVGAPQCYDRNHTLLHHLGMPVLVLADQEDNTVSDGPAVYAEDLSYTWPDISDFRRRILDQGWDVVNFWGTPAREEGAGTPGDFVVILPKTRRINEPLGRAIHVRFHDDLEMARTMTLCTPGRTVVSTASYNQMLGAWFTDTLPQTFAIEDAARPLPNGNYWVTGSSCLAAE